MEQQNIAPNIIVTNISKYLIYQMRKNPKNSKSKIIYYKFSFC
jgi:hypothetical protein